MAAAASGARPSHGTMVLPRIQPHPRRMSHRHADGRIYELAGAQHGVVTRSQLVESGVSPGAIDHRLRKGTLRRIHRGVYSAGPIAARYRLEMAAVLACGPSAALSDRTAAAVWGLAPPRHREAPIDVVGPRSLRGPASGVRLHRRVLSSDEVSTRHGIPLTTPPRTLLDLASSLGPHQLERTLAGALRRGLVGLDAIEAMLLRHPRRRGCRALRALVRDAAGPALTRSEGEARFLALLRKGGVPRPRVNAVVGGLEVDFLWPEHGIVAEVDGFAFHSHRSAFENDRRRDAILAAGGLTVVRVTWRQLQHEPERVLARLCMALGARSVFTGTASRSTGKASTGQARAAKGKPAHRP